MYKQNFQPLTVSQIICITGKFSQDFYFANCLFLNYWQGFELSRVTRKPDFCLCENKGADQLRSNCEADQRLCFRYTDSTLSLLIKSEISSFYAASGTVHVGLCHGNPEDQFSRVAAQFVNECCTVFYGFKYRNSSLARTLNS